MDVFSFVSATTQLLPHQVAAFRFYFPACRFTALIDARPIDAPPVCVVDEDAAKLGIAVKYINAKGTGIQSKAAGMIDAAVSLWGGGDAILCHGDVFPDSGAAALPNAPVSLHGGQGVSGEVNRGTALVILRGDALPWVRNPYRTWPILLRNTLSVERIITSHGFGFTPQAGLEVIADRWLHLGKMAFWASPLTQPDAKLELVRSVWPSEAFGACESSSWSHLHGEEKRRHAVCQDCTHFRRDGSFGWCGLLDDNGTDQWNCPRSRQARYTARLTKPAPSCDPWKSGVDSGL